MASQSPTQSPIDQEAATEALRYVRAWQATSEMLRLGHNWSGHEANVCFLNTRSPHFVDVSAVSGIDYFDDARGVAVVDWGRDGDLDLWFTNRTSPRVRYLENQASRENHSIALRLRGVTCNRDAIGARVELHRTPDSSDPLIQTVRAGDGYLAQSSKTVHFGLGDNPPIEKVVVRWPGGGAEEFAGLAADQFYELVQGEGTPRKLDPRTPRGGLPLAGSPRPQESGTSTRIVAARRLPLPELEYATLDGKRLHLNGEQTGPRVLMLWAPWCQPCLAELAELADNASRLQQTGLEILPINVDGANSELANTLDESAELLRRLGFDGEAGAATSGLLDALDVAQRVLTNKPFPPPIPSSFLLDGDGRLACVYKGPVSVDQLIHDVKDLSVARADPRDSAVPFSGRWYTAPFPPDLLAIPARLIQIGKPETALSYLNRVDTTADADNAEFVRLFAADLATTYVQLAKHFAAEKRFEVALAALRKAAEHQKENWDAHFGMAAIFGRLGRQREAAEEYRTLLKLRPDHAFASRNLAWILATSGDPPLRNPSEAVRLAAAACEASQYADPSDLDVLAAAYAAAGRFDQATETAKRAMSILSDAGQEQAAAAMAQRLRLYEQHRALGASASEASSE